MRKRRSLFAALGLFGLLLYILGCDSASNPVAPSGSVLTVSANPTRISLNGQSTITVIGFRPDGNPLSNGTLVNLSTDLGVLAQTVIEVTGSGRASTTLSGDGTAGTAMISASLPGSSGGGGEGGGTAGGSTTVQIGETADTSPKLSITASPSIIGLGESAEISAIARNSDDSPFGSGGSVTLRTSLGSLRNGFVTCTGSSNSSITVETDANSEAKATLCAGDQPGMASITGMIGSSATGAMTTATATVTIENQMPTLLVTANPSTVGVGAPSEITILARDDQGFALGSNERIQLTAEFGRLTCEQEYFCADTQGADCRVVCTNTDGEARAVFTAGERPGNGRVTAILRNGAPTEVLIEINDAPASFSFNADRGFVSAAAEAEVTLTVEVQNSLGTPLSGASVTFGTDPNVGGSFDSGSFIQTTGPDGSVVDTFRIPQGELTVGTNFFMTAIVRGEGVELPEKRIEIEVRP